MSLGRALFLIDLILMCNNECKSMIKQDILRNVSSREDASLYQVYFDGEIKEEVPEAVFLDYNLRKKCTKNRQDH